MLPSILSTASEKFGGDACRELARAVVAEVESSLPSLPPNVYYRRLPGPSENPEQLLLELERRTFNCLEREGLIRKPAQLFTHTIGSIIDCRGFGSKSLVDLLTSIESTLPPMRAFLAGHGVSQTQLLLEVGTLRDLCELDSVRREDPRFGPFLRSLDGCAAPSG